MNSQYEGVYLPTSTSHVYESTPLANAGWYDEGQHGGAFAALVVGHIEREVPTLSDLEVARVTVELFKVVPLVPLRIEPEIVREGKRIQHVTAHVVDPQGDLLSVVNVQRLRRADLPIPDEARPEDNRMPALDEITARVGDVWGVGEPGRMMFHRSAIEVREAIGGFGVPGPGAVWIRLAVPVIAGRETTQAQRAVAAGDFCNGVSRALDMKRWVFMNPDLTIHLARYPEGEWVGLDAASGYGDLGRGVATGTLWDPKGWLGRSTQTLYLDQMG